MRVHSLLQATRAQIEPLRSAMRRMTGKKQMAGMEATPDAYAYAFQLMCAHVLMLMLVNA